MRTGQPRSRLEPESLPLWRRRCNSLSKPQHGNGCEYADRQAKLFWSGRIVLVVPDQKRVLNIANQTAPTSHIGDCHC
jgi:hypothetical protein